MSQDFLNLSVVDIRYCVYPTNYSNHLSPCKLLTILLLMVPFTFFTHPPTLSLLVTIPLVFVSMRLFCFFICSFFHFFHYCPNTVVPHFSPLLSLALPPQSILTPLSMPMDPLYMFLDLPLHLPSCYTPPPSPLVTVSLFFISMPLVIFCSFVCFVDQVPLKGEIIWYLSFTTGLFHLA